VDISLSPSDITAIALLVAPGYITILVYSSIRAKTDKDFSRLLVESIALSYIIVSFYNRYWHDFTNRQMVPTSLHYLIPLFGLSFALGLASNFIRDWEPIRWLFKKLKIPGPDDDFIRAQFRKLKKNTAVTVKLRNGKVFSGTPQGGSAYKKDTPREYYFNNVAWYKKGAPKGKLWEPAKGSLIVNLDDVEYMETGEVLHEDDPRLLSGFIPSFLKRH